MFDQLLIKSILRVFNFPPSMDCRGQKKQSVSFLVGRNVFDRDLSSPTPTLTSRLYG